MTKTSRVLAPPVTMSDDPDIDPPTGIPWKSPAAMLPAPCPTKSRDVSAGLPSGVGRLAPTAAPWMTPTKASEKAGISRNTTSSMFGSTGAGRPFGTSTMSSSSSTGSESQTFSSTAMPEPSTTATTSPREPTGVRRNR